MLAVADAGGIPDTCTLSGLIMFYCIDIGVTMAYVRTPAESAAGCFI